MTPISAEVYTPPAFFKITFDCSQGEFYELKQGLYKTAGNLGIGSDHFRLSSDAIL